MKKRDLDKFEKILIGEKGKILNHLTDLSKGAEADLMENYSGDPADIASVEVTQAAMQKIGSRESRLLKKIDLALSKIRNRTYGECEECGEEIGIPRLMARPVAQLCIDCKTEQESKERHYSSDSEDDSSRSLADKDD